jgi:hypothetical protein
MGFTASRRRHSARMRRFWAALFICAVAFPSAASADPARESSHWHPWPGRQVEMLPSHLPAAGTDVSAADQQAPVPVAVPRGTDVAAVDQQAPKSVAAVPDPGAGSSDFDWTAALIGGGVCLAGFAIAGAFGLRRRRTPLAG